MDKARQPAQRAEVGAGQAGGQVLTQPRLAYLDSLRALAALAVVVLHAFQQYGLGLSPLVEGTERYVLGPDLFSIGLTVAYERLIHYGQFAVQVFIIISGFSLMLGIVRSADGRLVGGPFPFFRRRARRILPPYYAALALSLLLITLIPGLNRPAGVYWDTALPALEPWSIISHLLLIHNAHPTTHLTINPPMWSIAVEWQIYALFLPLVLLWRGWGMLPTVALTLVWGALPFGAPIPWYPLSQAWFVGLFALGMLGAEVSFSRRPVVARWRERLPWLRLALLAVVAFVATAFLTGRLGLAAQTLWLRDYLLGLAVVCLLIQCARLTSRPPGRPPRYLRLLEAPRLVSLGRFSYSLYLVHAPVLALVALACREAALSVVAGYAVIVGAGIPLAILVAYLFFLVFERPFLTARPRRARQGQARAEPPTVSRSAP